MVNSAILQAQGGNGGISHLLGGEEDSDEWLVVNERMLDNMLARSQPTLNTQGGADMDVDEDPTERLEETQAMEQANQLRTLASKVGSFVEGKGDVEGATFEE
jgi:hypothetical protein